ncbi:MAG: hypothetical protein JWM56_664 [Candidatus Peribacteria bacterium]|nr:hypothetical protein [Candidatus Peribacteria bacterium]
MTAQTDIDRRLLGTTIEAGRPLVLYERNEKERDAVAAKDSAEARKLHAEAKDLELKNILNRFWLYLLGFLIFGGILMMGVGIGYLWGSVGKS